MSNAHERLLTDFYQAFVRKDAAAMGACYHPEAVFTDEVFVGLPADRIRAMWAMFCEPGGDLHVEFSDVRADAVRGQGHWDASYTFSMTGRKVLNRIDSEFEFKDGLILRHKDRFDFWRWSRQALGLPGLLLGWTPIIRGAVQKKARAALERFVRKQGAAG